MLEILTISNVFFFIMILVHDELQSRHLQFICVTQELIAVHKKRNVAQPFI